MEGDKDELFKLYDDFKRWNDEIISDINKFKLHGEHTVDVDCRMDSELKIATRASEEVFSLWKSFRFKHLKAHPRMLESMIDIGGEYSNYSLEAGRAWKFPDSQHLREADPVLFRTREDIEGSIRDSLHSMSDIRLLAREYKKRYGEHDNLISDRSFQWITFVGGIVAGVFAAVLTAVVSKHLGIKG